MERAGLPDILRGWLNGQLPRLLTNHEAAYSHRWALDRLTHTCLEHIQEANSALDHFEPWLRRRLLYGPLSPEAARQGRALTHFVRFFANSGLPLARQLSNWLALLLEAGLHDEVFAHDVAHLVEAVQHCVCEWTAITPEADRVRALEACQEATAALELCYELLDSLTGL
jgi:hypothetical protein